jgi:signal transduction histidine kinase
MKNSLHLTEDLSDLSKVTAGRAVKRDDGNVLLTLDPVEAESDLGKVARRFGQEEERSRIVKLFHDNVAPKLMAAVFEAQRIKEDLELHGLKQSEEMSKVTEKLTETINSVISVLDPEKPKGGN